jgi:hypothetical protein
VAFCHGVSEFCLRKHAWPHRQTHFHGWKYVCLSALLFRTAAIHRQPDRGLLRGRPGNSVLRVGGDVEVVAGAKLYHAAPELQAGRTYSGS